MELVCYFVEYLQLIFQQACLLKVADEVNLWRNGVLAVLLLLSVTALRILRLVEGATILHSLLYGCLLLLVALSWQVGSSCLIKSSLCVTCSCSNSSNQSVQLLFFKFIFVLSESVRELLDQLSHVAYSGQLRLEVGIHWWFVFLTTIMKISLLIKLVKEGQEWVWIIGSCLPAISICVACAAASAFTVAGFGLVGSARATRATCIVGA